MISRSFNICIYTRVEWAICGNITHKGSSQGQAHDMHFLSFEKGDKSAYRRRKKPFS